MTFEPLTPERRRAMTRQHLLEAAAIVFGRKGFHGATLDEVASLAGFTKGAVYSNFKSKDDLFLALLHDKVERQFAVTAEVLGSVPHDGDSQRPLIRELLRSGAIFWDDEFDALYLEFVLYARRNPEVREKLAASAQREREYIESLIEHEYDAIGVPAKHLPRALAEISRALFNGLGISRLVDPEAIDDEVLGVTLEVLYGGMGIDDPVDDQ